MPAQAQAGGKVRIREASLKRGAFDARNERRRARFVGLRFYGSRIHL
jgi:hypothetical protein